MARDGRTADRQRVGPLADRSLARAKQLDDRASMRISKRVERVAGAVRRGPTRPAQ